MTADAMSLIGRWCLACWYSGLGLPRVCAVDCWRLTAAGSVYVAADVVDVIVAVSAAAAAAVIAADVPENCTWRSSNTLCCSTHTTGDDVYMFESFHTSSTSREVRRPKCETLYDTFVNIRDDEGEHVHTMVACHDEALGAHLEAKYGDTGKEITEDGK